MCINLFLPAAGFVESTSNIVKLPNISGILLEKVCEYLYFNLKYKNKTGVPQFEIPPELALEMLVVADFLDSKYNSSSTLVTTATNVSLISLMKMIMMILIYLNTGYFFLLLLPPLFLIPPFVLPLLLPPSK